MIDTPDGNRLVIFVVASVNGSFGVGERGWPVEEVSGSAVDDISAVITCQLSVGTDYTVVASL